MRALLQRGRRPSWLLAVLGMLCAGQSGLQALDSDRAMSQYIHERWGIERGFPSGVVHAIAQTPDGYLWLGTDKGLIQFDGVSFRLFRDQTATPSSPVEVLGLVVDAAGDLWVRRRGANLQRYSNGRVRDALWPDYPKEDAVTAIRRARDGGVILSGLINGVLRYTHQRFEPLATTVALNSTPVTSIAESSDGRIWLGTRGAGLFNVVERRVTAVTSALPNKTINALLPVGDRDMWIGTDGGVVRWNGSEATSDGVPASLRRTRALAMISDRDSNVWIGTAEGLVRINARGVASFDDRHDHPSHAVTALFEDREGNLWAGGPAGLERLREGSFTTFGRTEGLPSERIGPLHVDSSGRVWFAPVDGGLYWLDEGRVGRVDAGLRGDIVYSIAGGGDELWLGRQRGGLTRLRVSGSGVTVGTFTKKDGLADNSVFAVHRNPDGTVWAGTLNGGVSRWHDGGLTTFTVANGLASNTIASILRTSDGTMWFATPQGLSALSIDHWRTYRTADGLPSDNVNALLEDATGSLWIGSAGGLAVIRSGNVQRLANMPSGLRDQISGLAEDRTGSLWIATSNRVLQVNAEQLRRGDVRDADLREYDLQDGLRSIEAMRRDRSLIQDSRGRIWLTTTRGLSVVDPARLNAHQAPALAHVESVLVDGSAVDVKAPLHIPPGRERIRFEFVGLSLSSPGRVRFRYRLDGVDRDWTIASVAREAIYRSLGPGSYRFRLMAANPDGQWTESSTPVAFTVDPAFWQTAWFRVSSVLALVLAAAGAYHVRTRQLTRQLNLRFEERLAERTRIAQELHDTLLQGFLSASMQLHLAVSDLPDEAPLKPTFNRVLDLIGRVIDEGRSAVRGLRSSSTDDLEHALCRVQEEYAAQNHTDFRVVVEGHVRALHPLIRDEVYRIGREALVNAFRHSGATSIEVELQYGSKQLRMLVRDNGRGVDPTVLQSGVDGHWGLPGMRERATRIGGHLTLWSRAAAGTEVELSLPAHVAFDQHGVASLQQ
jgi:ligand-binding sensor domain-containing protein/signal transduction histidine kinase